jgi:DNA-binding CsgD family transcriptional regulator
MSEDKPTPDGSCHESGCLTTRQREVLCRTVDGLAPKEIGRVLGISNRTVESHLLAAYSKIGARNVRDAVRIAIISGIYVPDRSAAA